MIHMLTMVVLCVGVAVLSACASGEVAQGRAHDRYVFAYLKTGPNSAAHTAEQKQEIFQGHMANMQRLSAERKLLIAGPFAKPTDPAWRGVFVFDVRSVAEAEALMATDPGVSSGEFVGECRAMRGSPALREFLDIYKVENAKRSAEPRDPTQPPPIRAFVMVTAESHTDALAALTRGGLAERVVWWGELEEAGAHTRSAERGPGGVYVIDAEKVEDVRSGIGAGAWSIDGWWSDELLVQVPREAIGG